MLRAGTRQAKNQSSDALRLTVIAQCLPKGMLGNPHVITRDVVVDPQLSGVAALVCPSGQVAVSGGAFWHRKGHPMPQATLAGFLSGWFLDLNSLPGNTRSIAAGFNPGAAVLVLRETALCVISAAFQVSSNGSSGTGTIATGNTAEHYAACGPGEHVISGGAYWTFTDGDVMDTASAASLVGSSVTANALDWYGAGKQTDFAEGLQGFEVANVCANL